MTKIILIADDDKTVRKMMSMVLDEGFPNYGIESFEDGTSLNERLKQGSLENVCMVITDNQMPGMSGLEVIEKHARKLKEQGIPMILHYAGDREIGVEAVRNGAYASVDKLSSQREFYRIILDALSEREGMIKEHS